MGRQYVSGHRGNWSDRYRDEGSDLFVVDGTSGTATPRGPSWVLSLTKPTVLWFKDHPARGSGTMPVSSLVSAWGSDFTGAPPFGAIVAPAGPPGHQPTAVRITDPIYDSAGDTVSFVLTPDRGETAADTDGCRNSPQPPPELMAVLCSSSTTPDKPSGVRRSLHSTC